jgi:hypothetical protein
MNEPLTSLLERMHASRAALADELDRLGARHRAAVEDLHKSRPAKRLKIAASFALASAVVMRLRRRARRC